MQDRGIDADTGINQGAFAVVDLKHLAGKSPEIVDRSLRAGMAILGAVAEPHNPFRRMPQMIGAFLLGFRRDRRQRRVARLHHRAPIEVRERRIEKLPHHSDSRCPRISASSARRSVYSTSGVSETWIEAVVIPLVHLLTSS